MKKAAIYIAFSLIIFLFGCRKDQLNDCFQSTGSDITEHRDVGSFTKINVGENFDILLVQDSTKGEQVSVTCGKNIIGQITTKVKHGTLEIENKNTCNFVRSYNRKITIEIRVKFLDDIELRSASNMRSDDTLHFEKIRYFKLKNYGLGDINLKLMTGFLDVNTINSGNIVLEGFANILTCSIEEVTQLDARNFLCDDIYIDSHTPLDCFVNPRVKLYAKIFNSGNVYYKNEPMNKPEVVAGSGSGELLKL